jgi:hypothetical protein
MFHAGDKAAKAARRPVILISLSWSPLLSAFLIMSTVLLTVPITFLLTDEP